MDKVSVLYLSFLYFALASWESTLNNGTLGGFFTLDEINTDMSTIINSFPDLASGGSIGQSSKGVNINFIKLAGQGIPSYEKGGALVTSSLYSGYPTNPSLVMFLLKDFANNYSKNSIERSILLKTNIYFIPVINVDAYKQMEQSYTEGSSFEVVTKNFKDTGCENSTQAGVNLDRNWEFNWGNSTGDSSNNPCDPKYRGSSAFSESETSSVKNFIIDKNITVWIHFDEDKNVYILPYTSMSMDPITVPDPMFGWAYNDLKSFFPLVNISYGTAKKIDGKLEDGTLIDFALSKGIFSMKGEIAPYDKSENIMTYFNPHLQSALWNLDGASYSLEGEYYFNWYECYEYPDYCQNNDSSIFFENEFYITNYGFKNAKSIALNFTWNYADNIPGYNFSLQTNGYYALYRIMDDENITDYINIDFSNIEADDTSISAEILFDVPALTYVDFIFYIEGTRPNSKDKMNSYWNISINHAGLPDAEALKTNIDWDISLDSDNKSSSDDDSHISKGAVIGITIGVIVIFLIIVIGLIIYIRQRRREANSGLMKQTYEPAFKDSQPSKGFSPPFEIQIPPERFEPQRI
ncbi:unnamed protein product [Blepharisma stoltei]|uniref:Peptidase M14 domain-containing protein n=1 Tax=Blepharisma stoltei TaxID=1481888 RepID=A0AAU9JY83_9CILI|nr:unnamed protein product [Blepharisma stoltei]